MDVVSIITRLSATTSRTDKEQIITDAFMKGHRDFFVGARLAYDIMVTFGVAKAALIEEDDGADGTLTFSDFLALAQRLRKRELTGHAARDAINAAAERCHAPTWNLFYRRILLKNLQIGVEASTINKVLAKLASAYPEAKDYMVPVFSCQLAHDGADEKHAKKIKGRKMLDIKLDGVRLLTVLDKEQGIVTQYTRNGKQNDNFPEIREKLKTFMDNCLPGSVVLDGEIISTSFQDLMTQVNRRDNIDTSNTKLGVFDIIPLADFKAGRCAKTQEQRHDILVQLVENGMLKMHCDDSVYVIPKIVVDLDTPEGQQSFKEFNRTAIDAGYEGVMVKSPNAPYETKRSDAWLKIKPFLTVDLTVVDLQEGEADGKYAGMLGALVCEGTEDGKNIRVNVGTGLTDRQRVDFWNSREKVVGQIIEVKADCITLGAGEEVYSLRFPRFVRFRSLDLIPGVKD